MSIVDFIPTLTEKKGKLRYRFAIPWNIWWNGLYFRGDYHGTVTLTRRERIRYFNEGRMGRDREKEKERGNERERERRWDDANGAVSAVPLVEASLRFNTPYRFFFVSKPYYFFFPPPLIINVSSKDIYKKNVVNSAF